MFKVPDHQVAGHQACNGVLGPLIDDSGLFYKPLQSDERGLKEQAFYESFYLNIDIPGSIHKFFPTYHGTRLIETSNGSGLHPHLVLQDIVFAYHNPCVMDIKIGSRTWHPQASEDYIQKCLKKDRSTSSLELGFRVSGIKVHESKGSDYWKPGKKFFKNLTTEDVRSILKKFVSSNPSADANMEPDCSFASTVYGDILSQLSELKSWFEEQTIFHFYSCSILLVYDTELIMQGKSSGAIVKLIDFAHVVEGRGVIDHNFLGGLCSLIKFLSEIRTNLPYSSTIGPGNDLYIPSGKDSLLPA